MAIQAPKLYFNDAETLAARIEQELTDSGIGWQGQSGGSGRAMVLLFSRLAELVGKRLNKVPEKHLYAFLNSAGIGLLSPCSSKIELTFGLAEDGPSFVLLPTGSQMATVQTETRPEIIFETTQDMVLCPNSLTACITFDQRNISDRTDRANGVEASSFTAFKGSQERVRTLYLADDDLFSFADEAEREASTITLTISFKSPGDADADGWTLRWLYWDGDAWCDLSASVNDGTDHFSKNGRITLTNLPELGGPDINGKTATWIACDLTGGVSRNALPEIQSISGRRAVVIENRLMSVDTLFSAIQSGTTFLPLEPSDDMFPFGQRPSRLDAFYIRSDAAFRKHGATVELSMKILHAPDDPKDKTLSAVLTWEYYGADGWTALKADKDTTGMFRQSGDVTFTFSVPEIALYSVNDTLGYWIRAWVSSGSYDIEGGMTQVDGAATGVLEWTPPGIHAPLIRDFSMQLSDYTGPASSVDSLSTITAKTDSLYTDFSDEIGSGDGISPFAAEDEGPGCYMAFEKAFPEGKWIQILIDVEESFDGSVVWEYYNGQSWQPLRMSDNTAGLSERGYLGFFAPEDSAFSEAFGIKAYWIRVYPDESLMTESSPYLETIRLNTVTAENATTIRDTVLGSSDGKPAQQFSLKRAPVLSDCVIVVKEPDLPPDDELSSLLTDLKGNDPEAEAIYTDDTESSNPGVWVRWLKVDDFYSSTSSSRHYRIDPEDGWVIFGDGVKGKIPPVGPNTIRAVMYRVHDGSKGNVEKGAVTVVRNPSGSLAHIKTVVNHESAAGGTDVETMTSLKNRGPQQLKHRSRAVAEEDYEWLAKEASGEVLKARCYPVTDANGNKSPGHVSLVITPVSDDPRPYPGAALLRTVREYVENHALVNLKTDTGISVTGPSYIDCSIRMTVKPENPEKSDAVELKIIENLDGFLHPLKGGPEGTGWDLGRNVYYSEICAVVENTEGVDYLDTLSLSGSLQQYLIAFKPENGDYRTIPYHIPEGAMVGTFDERIRLILAESLISDSGSGTSETAQLKTIAVYGFRTGDRVAVVTDTNVKVKDNLTIGAIDNTDILFDVPFDVPSDWDQRGALMATDTTDTMVRIPLAGTDNFIVDAEGRITGIRVIDFSDAVFFCIVSGTRRDPMLEFIPVASITTCKDLIYIPEGCLTCSANHDIDMII